MISSDGPIIPGAGRPTSRRVRRATAASVVLFVGSTTAFGQSPPPGLEPLPDVPPPPKLSTVPTPSDDEAPQVTIRQDGETKIEEFRSKSGRVYAIRVTPRIGKPYLLVDPDGKGTMTNADEINQGVRPAQWTLFEF